MTIYEAISKADELRNNKIDEPVKVAMLSELDGRIHRELIDPRGENGEFHGYGESTPSDTRLLADYPYDGLYVAYLDAEICRLNGEIQKYSAARNIFFEKYEAYRAWYARTHKYGAPNIKFPTRRY